MTGQDLLGLGDEAACDSLVQAVRDAHQCPLSLLLLDDVEVRMRGGPHHASKAGSDLSATFTFIHPQALVHYSAINDGPGGGRVAADRLHTMLALLGRAPSRAATDDDDDEGEENGGGGGSLMTAARRAANRTCVIVATTALDDATLARLGLLPKYGCVWIACGDVCTILLP